MFKNSKPKIPSEISHNVNKDKKNVSSTFTHLNIKRLRNKPVQTSGSKQCKFAIIFTNKDDLSLEYVAKFIFPADKQQPDETSGNSGEFLVVFLVDSSSKFFNGSIAAPAAQNGSYIRTGSDIKFSILPPTGLLHHPDRKADGDDASTSARSEA